MAVPGENGIATDAEVGTGLALYRTAERYLGVPLRHAGRDRFGVDCIGLVGCVLHDLGLTDYYYRDQNYLPADAPARLQPEIERYFRLVPTERAISGDLALLFIDGIPQHCGFLSPDDRIIHARERYGGGTVVASAYSRFWQRYVAGIYRWRGEH